MADTLLQRARDIVADQYIRLEMKNPTPDRSADEWARHIESYTRYLREGAYDQERDVQVALVALRSISA